MWSNLLSRLYSTMDGGIKENVDHKNKVRWMICKMTSGVLCDKMMQTKKKSAAKYLSN